MASTTFSLNITAADGETPVTSDRRQTLQRLRNYLARRLSGTHQGLDTMYCRTATATATAVVTCATVQNADTVTVNGVALTATQHHARGTITPTVSGIDVDDTLLIDATTLTAKRHHATATCTITIANTDVGDTVTINGVDFTAAAAEDLEAGEFDISGTATVAATSLAACITASESEDIAGVVTATSSSGVVTVRAVATGVAGNSITFVSSDADGLTVTGSGFLANAVAVAADTFDITGTNAQCCTSILAAIDANAALTAILTASTTATVVTIRNKTAGTAGNSVVLTSSDAQLAVSGAGTMTGGAAVSNNQFDFGGTNAETATALAAAINASTSALVNKHVTAAASSAAVTLTATIPGYAGNAVTIATADGTRLAITGSASRLTGGTETLTTHTY